MDEGKPLTRLAHVLLAKSVLEAVFVGVLAVGFYLTVFPPYFRGTLDVADANQVAGWAVREGETERVEVHLYIDGRFVAHTYADQPRPDVREAGRAADEFCGFRFTGPFALEAGRHEARVYASHESGGGARRALQMIDKPLIFVTD
jgi:hypothetical protein